MKNKKMLSTLFAAILVAASLVGCGEEAVDSSVTNSDTGASSTASTEDQNGSGYTSATGIPISAPGELPIVEDTYNLDVFIRPGDIIDFSTNTAVLAMEELTNVHLDMTVAPDDSFSEKLNLLLNSGEYPSVIMSAGFSNADLVKYGTKEKIFIPLNDLIETHGVTIKERWEEHPSWKTDMITPDGNIYGIPSTDSGIVGHSAVPFKCWINTDWLEVLNLDIPETTEEFREVLLAFKNNDPNGNGEADEISLTGATGTWAGLPYLYLMNAFGYYDETLLMLKDNVFTGTANQDYIKEGLIYINGLYNEGLLDPAAFTQNEQQMSAIGNNAGNAIMGAVTCGHLGMAISPNDIERSKMYSCLAPLEGPNGYRGIPFRTELQLSGAKWVITDACKDPEIAIKWADAFCREDITVRMQVGEKGQTWDDADPNTVGMDGKTPATRKYLQFSTSGEGGQNYKFGSQRLLETNWKGTFQVVGDIRDPSNYEAFLYQETEKLRPYAADVQQIPAFYLDEDQSARLSQLSTPLVDYVRSSFVEFITGKKNIENDWQAYVDGLENLNYSEYIEMYQNAYDALTK
ncbi:MAG: hypothetical protein ACOX6P_10160 [Candidatus Merdivicinus sp.]|jgi:putative aldouronate transport system substrate-binding protein